MCHVCQGRVDRKRFPCFLFQDCPDEVRPQTQSDAESPESEASEEETDEKEVPATEQRRGRLLKNENGYYVIDAHAINELLDVNKYIEAWPQIPTEELHASSRYNTPATRSIDGC